MKKQTKRLSFLFFLLAICALQLKAQDDYTPFDLQNSIWEEDYYELASFRQQYNYLMDGDTIINEVTYQKIRQVGRYSLNYDQTPTFWEDIDNYAGAIRENDQKQVFWVDPGGSEEVLMYDFNLTVGDTIAGHFFSALKVVGLDTIESCGQFRKRYELEPVEGPLLQPLYWTEGVGSNQGLFHRYEYFESGAYSLCFSDSSCSPCALVVSTQSLHPPNSQNLIQVFPNPVGTNLSIEVLNPLENLQLQVTDLLGRVVDRRNLSGQINWEFAVNWAPGIYLLYVVGEKSEEVVRILKK